MNLRIFVACLLSTSMGSLHAAPNTEGTWTGVLSWPLIPMHAVLTPQGKVFTWGTDSAGTQTNVFNYDLWSPAVGMNTNSHLTLPNTVGVDSFCSAALLLPETGEVIMAGGDARPQGVTNGGIKNVLKYNTNSGALSSVRSMSMARWYPTTTTLANGEILTVGGIDLAQKAVVTPEIYSPSTNRWRSMLGVSTAKYDALYPRMWVVPDGRVFSISKSSSSFDVGMYYMNTNGAGSIRELNRVLLSYQQFGNSTAVMYRPGKILLVADTGDASNIKTMIIDVTGANPVVRNVASPGLRTGRKWADTVILPNGKVMLVGGSSANIVGGTLEDNVSDRDVLDNVSYRPLIWDPATELWSTMSAHSRSRLYHSTALLLKDGRVLVGGGGTPGPQTNTDAEIFSPPYLYNNSGGAAPRPAITRAPKQAGYGATISVAYASSKPISRVTLVKTGAVTHSINMDQRFIELDYSDASNSVRVKLPSSQNIATPGYYLIHLIDNKGVPSQGHIIKIGRGIASGTPLVARPDNVSASSGPTVIDALANDSGNGLILSVSSIWSQQGGQVAVANNKFRYTAKPGFNGADKIFYTVKDSQGRTAWSSVTITVRNNSANPFPVGKVDTLAATAGVERTVDVLANDIGNGLVLVAPNVWSWKGGSVRLLNNKLRYRAKPGFAGLDKIWYTFKDVQGRQAWSVANINVSAGATNPFPAGRPDSFNVVTSRRTNLNVLANDIGNGLVLNPFNTPFSQKGGSIFISANRVSYQSKAGYVGTDKVWYTFRDVQGRLSYGEATINVTR